MSITRSITRPIVRGITRGIVRGDLDADAAAYIAAVETALSSSISGDQKNAINDFIKAGKSDGWYSSLKRLYLPIWADAAANAIDMVTRTSGTFPVPSGVDQSNVGYVQGNGTTGYFTSDTNPHAVGMSSSTGGLVALVKTAPTGAGFAAMGGVAGATTAVQLYHNADIVVGTVAGNPPTAFYSGSRATNTGVWMTSRTAVNALSLFQRSASGFFTRDFDALDVTGNSATTVNMTFMSQTGAIPSDAEFGAYGMILGLSTANATAFTLALKNLWETASGLTLPP